MQTLPTIREANLDDLETLVDTLSDSFANDPVLNWVIPRPQLYPDLFRLFITDIYFPRGIVHLEDGGRGAALWLPPGEVMEVPPRLALLNMVMKLLLHKGPRPLWRLHQQGEVFARHHPKEPHYYLQFIGCRARDQGQGVGAALIKQGTRECDEQGMPAYLESSNSLNVPLYQRHGFEVFHEQCVTKNGPKAWFMWREPR
ncbi:MAG: GNAT family N-acetyltransferase [Halioglobus sp.]